MLGPLVSILVRSIGRDTLKQALASVAAQDYRNIEVWVVAATPRHAPLAAAGAPFPVELVPTEHPLPRAKAANRALECARGQLALFLDDDDWIAPSHVSALVRALMPPAHAGAGAKAPLVAYTRTQTTDAEGKTDGQPVIGGPFDAIQLLAGNTLALHSALFSLELRSLGCRFDESLDLYEDWDFWLQAAQHGPFSYVDQTTAFYRIHDSSGVHSQGPFRSPAWLAIYAKWMRRWSAAQLAALMQRAARYKSLDAEAAELHVRVAATAAQLSRAQADSHRLRQQIDGITSSRSWRVTAPLRSAARQAINLRSLALAAMRQPRLLPARIYRLARRWVISASTKAKLTRSGRVSAGDDYASWIAVNEPSANTYPDLARQADGWARCPLISVLMPTYNSSLEFLGEAIDSVRSQTYPHWELCIADDASSRAEVREFLQAVAASDPRIRLTLRERNGHISAASNSALASARGEWVALLDHDDRLHPLAIFFVVQALQQQEDAQIIYTDEDKISAEGQRFDPHFKSDWNPDLFLAQNYICHLAVIRHELLKRIGGFRLGVEGSQDYDLLLRCLAHVRDDQILHVPRVLYHWRAAAGSTALDAHEKSYSTSAGVKALEEHLKHHDPAIRVEQGFLPNTYHLCRPLPFPAPLVSLLIPTRNNKELIEVAVRSILDKTTYKNYEIIILDNQTTDASTLEWFQAVQLTESRVKVIRYDREFNFSAINNFGVRHATGSIIGLINNDTEVINGDWLTEMVSHASRSEIGCVGAKLYYSNGTLQHGGVILGIGGVAGHSHKHAPHDSHGYFSRLKLVQNLSAVTAACLVLRREVYLQVGGLDEENLAIAFNDVDLCLKVRKAGYRNLWTPYAELYHHESVSRGYEDTPQKQERFRREVAFMKSKWGAILLRDPYYNPNLTAEYEDFSINARPTL